MLPFGMLNVFLVVRDKTAMLIDTGLPRSHDKVEKALAKHGLDWSHLALTVLTHAHIDHAGSAVAVRERSKAPILAHRLEIDYCSGQAPLLKPTGPFGRLFQKTGAIEQPFDYFTPDIIVESQEYNLSDYGFPARVVLTPGHTDGSISVVLDDGRVMAGDLAASGILLGGIALRNRPKQPPFEEDARAVAKSLQQLLSLGCTKFYLGHGGPLSASKIKSHIEYLRGC